LPYVAQLPTFLAISGCLERFRIAAGQLGTKLTFHMPVSREFAYEWQFNGLATIRPDGFPASNAPNGIRRPSGVSDD
jgi:hypothetical protein